MQEIIGSDPARPVLDSQMAEVLRIDRPQRGSLRLIRSKRRSLYVIHLKRP
jgi:hypothetical protein